MEITNGFDLMQFAAAHRYILPAFNTTNLEMTYAIALGLNDAGLPGYIQISSHNLRLSSPAAIAALTRDALSDARVPIALHLDHGASFEDVVACVEAGFTSMMIDASKLSFEDNIRAVRRTVDYCHARHIPVEAELGALRGKEDDAKREADARTDPAVVARFVRESGCDLLAVSVGNVHGLDLAPHIDLPLLQRISEESPVPLVMHGGSGIPFDVIRQARASHLLKINYGSDLRREFIRTFGEAYEANHGAHDVMSLSVKAVQNVRNKARELVTRINEA
jgi:fructose-bisphosphate aldolase, class II